MLPVTDKASQSCAVSVHYLLRKSDPLARPITSIPIDAQQTQSFFLLSYIAIMLRSISVYLNWDLRRENARRDRMYGPACSPDLLHEGEPGYSKEENDAKLKQWGLEGTTEEERVTLGDRHPSFRYVP